MKRKLAFCAAILVAGFFTGTTKADAAAGDRRASTPQRSSSASSPARPASASRSATASTRHYAVTGRSTARQASRGGRYDGGGGISCVPYARSATGMEISGNGGQWWYNAAGLYARGQRPEPGSILAMPSSGGMRAGHVAVVERVVSPREITIHHANWGGPGIRRGSVMRGVSVVDVSDRNDWSAVRVQAGYDSDTFGRVYPVQGFIYNRPDGAAGGMLAATQPRSRNVGVLQQGRYATMTDLRGRYEELAAAPAVSTSPHAQQHLDLTRTGMSWGR